jgi:hypothetical protein
MMKARGPTHGFFSAIIVRLERLDLGVEELCVTTGSAKLRSSRSFEAAWPSLERRRSLKCGGSCPDVCFG